MVLTPEKIKKEDLLKEMEDLKNLMAHVEEEYRKANIQEKVYLELKERYTKLKEELERKLGAEKKEEVREKPKTEKTEEVVEEEKPEEEKKVVKKKPRSIIGKIFKRGAEKEIKEAEKVEETKKIETKAKVPEIEEEIEVGEIQEMTPEIIEKLASQVAREAGAEETGIKVEEEVKEEKAETPSSVEIEKLKVMIETMREGNKALEESIRNLSESIGELRSMVFHTEGSNKETALKLERIEDEISRIKPREIEKKFLEINGAIEKQQMSIEKLEKIAEDLANKINDVHKIIKSIGGIENLVGLNKDIQKKLEDMKELIKYTERMALKTEKVFIDLSKSLEDFVIYKTRQEGLEETVKELIKSSDAINLKVDSLPNKRDLEMIKGDILLIQKQIEEINKVLPIVRLKLPEPIESLKREKEDILLFLDSLEEQLKAKAISVSEYEIAKKKSLKKLAEIEELLKKEWETMKKFIERGEIPEGKESEKIINDVNEEIPTESETNTEEESAQDENKQENQ